MRTDDDVSQARRQFLWSTGATGAALLIGQRIFAAPRHTGFREPDDPVTLARRAALTDPIGVEPLRGKLRCITGCGGNIVALADEDGVVLVDSGMIGDRVDAAVATLTLAPIRYLINTHWHFDHTDANPWMAAEGATIVAQQNTRRHLSQSTYVADYDFTFPPLPPGGRPGVVFAKEHRLAVGRSTIALRHYGSAHTDGDIAVRFEEENVLHVGDTWWNGFYPFIDYSTGGGIDGLIAAARWNIAAATPETVIVPGHGPVGHLAELWNYYEMLVTVRDRVAYLKREGRTSVEVIAARPTASFDGSWGRGLVSPDFFTRLVYQGV